MPRRLMDPLLLPVRCCALVGYFLSILLLFEFPLNIYLRDCHTA